MVRHFRNRWMYRCGLGFFLVLMPDAGQGQQPAPLPPVPGYLSPRVRDSLTAVRAKLDERLIAYRKTKAKYDSRCLVYAPDDRATKESCDKEYADNLPGMKALSKDKAAFVTEIKRLDSAKVISSDPTVVVDASDIKKGTAAFGSKVSNPDLKKDANPNIVGSNTKAVDQLTSIAKNGERPGETTEAGSVKAGKGFDTGQKKKGSLSDVKVDDVEGKAKKMTDVPPGMEKDKIVSEGLARYNKVIPELKEAQKAVVQAQAASDKATGADAKAAAAAALNAAKAKSDGLQVAAQSAIKQVEERTIYLKKFTVAKPPEGDAKPPETRK